MENTPEFTQELHPITRELIAQQLRADGMHFYVDDRGEVWVFGDESRFIFTLAGEHEHVLSIVGLLTKHFPAKYVDIISAFIEHWHRNTLGPKVYSRMTDEGTVSIVTEHSLNMGRGCTRAQLSDQMAFAVSSTNAFIDRLYDVLAENTGEG